MLAVDFVVVTDHNVLVQGVCGYYGDEASGYVLLLTGEEIHDRTRLPQVNHLLVYNVPHEVVQYAPDPQRLLYAVNNVGGLSFIAHPFDHRVPWMRPFGLGQQIPWTSWEVSGYTGLEIWNFMSDWKEGATSFRAGLRALFRPDAVVTGPRPATL
ncbi:MAG: hypothetical protein HC915_14220, partial [Anaerolineae bacterium]|nr:hypothetical protein [Anaerolineae bacterium]